MFTNKIMPFLFLGMFLNMPIESINLNAQKISDWWTQQPMRLIQTNLREIDATLDVDTYVSSIKDYNANV
ncbi:MAG: hypothetical protein R3250_03190, partial [Melioribacteraceae bacterium]|nr:hypothetical protein [Melioribacteraceae bacterium]